MSEQQDPMHAQSFGAPNIEEAVHGGTADSKAPQKAEVGAGSSHLGFFEAQGGKVRHVLLIGHTNLFVLWAALA